MDNLDYSVDQKSANNNPYLIEGDKSISNMAAKRGSGEVSQLGNSNQKRKAKTKEELA